MIPILHSEKYLLHDTGYGHPERPERIQACADALKASDFAHELVWQEPIPADPSQILLAHTETHLINVREICFSGGGFMDPDTPVSSASYEIGLLSAGAWLQGVEAVTGNDRPAFVLSRPPGHHAEKDRAMGFCLFSNCALAAKYAIDRNLAKRVAIFDWDVHHGNGTQDIVQSDENIAYCSTHQFPFYPGTGAEWEKGDHNNVLNIPLSAGCDGNDYMDVFKNKVAPFLKNWEPDLLIISSGFDAARDDPLANMNLVPEDFAEMALGCLEIQPRMLVGLEGGYSLKALADSTVTVTRELLGHTR